jgi:hypothetical protein
MLLLPSLCALPRTTASSWSNGFHAILVPCADMQFMVGAVTETHASLLPRRVRGLCGATLISVFSTVALKPTAGTKHRLHLSNFCLPSAAAPTAAYPDRRHLRIEFRQTPPATLMIVTGNYRLSLYRSLPAFTCPPAARKRTALPDNFERRRMANG